MKRPKRSAENKDCGLSPTSLVSDPLVCSSKSELGILERAGMRVGASR
jgi:hypothetical protein